MTYFSRLAHARGYLRKQPSIYSTRPIATAAVTRIERAGGGVVIDHHNAMPLLTVHSVRPLFLDDETYGANVVERIALSSARAFITYQPAFRPPTVPLHMGSRQVTSTDRAIYMDRRRAQDTNIGPNPTVDRTEIGTGAHSSGVPDDDYPHFEGDIWRLACWNVVVADLVMRQIALGADPLFAHPRGLIAYLPLDDAQVIDWASATPWTRVNAFVTGHRSFEIPKRRKAQRLYGQAAAATIATGRRVVGR